MVGLLPIILGTRVGIALGTQVGIVHGVTAGIAPGTMVGILRIIMAIILGMLAPSIGAPGDGDITDGMTTMPVGTGPIVPVMTGLIALDTIGTLVVSDTVGAFVPVWQPTVTAAAAVMWI